MPSMNKEAAPSSVRKEPITTLIQVTGYKLEGDPKDHRILGVDLENRDENGVPKEVSVAIEPNSEKKGNKPKRPIPKPKEFANWANTKTEVGGAILVQRAVERDGELVADYAQRIAKDSNWVRQGNNGVDYKIGCQRGYVAVYPAVVKNPDDGSVSLEVVGGKNGASEYNKGNAYFYPDNAEVELSGGPGADEALIKAAKEAIDRAPDVRTQPMVMLYQADSGDHQKFFISNKTKDPQTNEYRFLTRDEMKAGLEDNKMLQHYAKIVSQDDFKGSPFRVREGFKLNVFDSVEPDPDKMNKVQKLAKETQRTHRMPEYKQVQTGKKVDIQNQTVFTHGYVSYEIPTDETQQVTLQKIAKMIDKNFDQKNSVNAGMSLLANPHFEVDSDGMYIDPDPRVDQMPNQPPQQQPQGQPASQQENHQAAMAAQVPIQGNQSQQAAPQQATPQQQAPQQQQPPAASANQGQPTQQPEPPMPTDDEIDNFLDESNGLGDIPDFEIGEFDDEMDEIAESSPGPR